MDTAEVIHLPVKRKRGRPRGSKNKVFRPDGREVPFTLTASKCVTGGAALGDVSHIKKGARCLAPPFFRNNLDPSCFS